MEKHEVGGKVAPGRPSYKIASIPADGIGPEVIAAGIQVLRTLATGLDEFDLEFDHFDWSSTYYRVNGKYLPDDALDILKRYNAILFGAVGDPGLFSPTLSSDFHINVKYQIGIICRVLGVVKRRDVTDMCKQISQTIFPCGD